MKEQKVTHLDGSEVECARYRLVSCNPARGGGEYNDHDSGDSRAQIEMKRRRG